MLSIYFLMMLSTATTDPAIAKPEKYDARQELTILDRADSRRDFNYEIRTADGRKVRTFCKSYTFNQVLVTYKASSPSETDSAFGYHISCRKERRKNGRLAIWIHGGPWARTSTELVLDQLAFVDSGYDLLVLLYPGSSERQVRFDGPTMDPDVVDAMTEVKVAVGWGRRHYRRVDVAGESFGAFLASSAAPFLGKNGSLFLINPGLGGKSRLEDVYSQLGDALKIERVASEDTRAEAKRITDAYFYRLHDYSALRVLQSTKGLKLKLVHGGRDKLMVPAEIKSLEALAVPGCGIDFRPENGHESAETPEQFESFSKLIRCGHH